MIFRKFRFILAGLFLCFSLLTVAHNSHGLGLGLGLGLNLKAKSGVTSLAAGSKVLMVGTSITDYGYRYHNETSSGTIGWVGVGLGGWLRALTGQQFDLINEGVAGSTINEIAARLPGLLIEHKPDVVIVEAGNNDGGRTYEQIISDLQGLYDIVDNDEAQLVPLTVSMRAPAGWGDVDRDKMLAVNSWIRGNYTKAIEINKFFMDPSTQRPYAAFLDGGSTHPSNKGGHALAKAVAEKLRVTGSRSVFGTPINSNPTLTGTGGSMDAGVTGTVPDDMRVDIIGGHSGTAVASADDPGLSLTFTPGGSGSVEEYEIRLDTELDLTVTLGSVVELLTQISLSAWDGWAYVTLRLYDPTIGSVYDLHQQLNPETYTYPEDELNDIILRTAPYAAQTSTVRMYLQIGIKDDADGTGTLSMSRFQAQTGELLQLLDIFDIALWLDAADVNSLTDAGGATSNAADKSGNSHDAAQSIEANKPTTGIRTINDLNVLDFDGSGDNMNINYANLYSVPAGDNTMFFVWQSDSAAAEQRLLNGFVSGNTRYGLLYNNATNTVSGVNNTSYNPATHSITSDTEPHIDIMRRSSSTLEVGRDGSMTSSANGVDVTLTSIKLASNSTDASSVNGAFAEGIIVSRALSDQEFNFIGNYLSAKWGISWTDF